MNTIHEARALRERARDIQHRRIAAWRNTEDGRAHIDRMRAIVQDRRNRCWWPVLLHWYTLRSRAVIRYIGNCDSGATAREIGAACGMQPQEVTDSLDELRRGHAVHVVGLAWDRMPIYDWSCVRPQWGVVS